MSSRVQRDIDLAQSVLGTIGWQRSEEPDVVLLAARANADLLASGLGGDRHELERQIDRLRALGREVDDGLGWGLSFAWDAFSDGSQNPVDTVYSYTTAAAAQALLAAYEVSGHEPYLRDAQAAADVLLTATCCAKTEVGFAVWYSDQEADQRPGYDVHNVSGLTLAVLARLDRLGYDTGHVRDGLAAHLVATQNRSSHPAAADLDVPGNWPYRSGDPRPNDLLHETFIIEGLIEHGSTDALTAARRALEGIVTHHFDAEGRPLQRRLTLGTRAWGPPAALYVLATVAPRHPATVAIAEHLAAAVSADGTVDVVEQNAIELAPSDRARGRAWYALALARYARALTAEHPLVPSVPELPADLRPGGTSPN